MVANYKAGRRYTVDYDLLFLKCQEALYLCKFNIQDSDPSLGLLNAKAKKSFYSGAGENINIQISQDGLVSIHSECISLCDHADHGKNKKNVEKFFKTVDTLINEDGFSSSKNSTLIPISFEILREHDIEVVGTENYPLDNRFGSHILTVEHEITKTIQSDMILETAHDLQGKLGVDLLNLLSVELSKDFTQKTGHTTGKSISLRDNLIFKVKPGDSILYKIIWKQRVICGEFEIIVKSDHHILPFKVPFDLEYEVSAQKR